MEVEWGGGPGSPLIDFRLITYWPQAVWLEHILLVFPCPLSLQSLSGETQTSTLALPFSQHPQTSANEGLLLSLLAPSSLNSSIFPIYCHCWKCIV